MKKNLFSTVLPFALLCLLVASCASSSGVVKTGSDTYMISKTQKGFRGASGPVLAAALEEANQYCVSRGKVLKVVSTQQKDMVPFKSDASAEVYFKCLDPEDPELKKEGASQNLSEAKPEDTYLEIARLDELRKSGALTQEEFDTEKKKVLARSK